jgi:nitronate monooxygenase
VDLCVEERIDVAVMAFGINRAMIARLTERGVLVFVMVGTARQARKAIGWGADGLIGQGCDAGGHFAGDTAALTFLPKAIEAAGGRPVLLAGTRFLLTHEARAHPEYQRRILAADKTFRTTLLGLGWPAPHRVVANSATGAGVTTTDAPNWRHG